MEKLRITVTDFIPDWEKYPIGAKDKNGKEICYGHTVIKNGDKDKYLIGYRYGKVGLRIPFTIFTVHITDYSKVEVLNEVTAAEDWLIIGYDNEPFVQQLLADGKKG